MLPAEEQLRIIKSGAADIIPEELLEKFGKALIELCHRHCDPLLPNGELTVLLITENGKIYS